MARLIYSAIASLDGYVADEQGNFDRLAPDEEVHAFVNDLERTVGTHLYGRRMYEVMVWWETMDTAGEPDVMRDFAEIWWAADKVVYSRTLEAVASERTRIEREFEPETVRQMKATTERDISVGGPELAGQALAAGLVDECHLFLAPRAAGRRHPGAAGRRAAAAGAAGRAPVRKRRRAPALPGRPGGLIVGVGRAAQALVLARPPLALDALAWLRPGWAGSGGAAVAAAPARAASAPRTAAAPASGCGSGCARPGRPPAAGPRRPAASAAAASPARAPGRSAWASRPGRTSARPACWTCSRAVRRGRPIA